MLSEVKIYKPTKDGLKLEKVISKKEIKDRADENFEKVHYNRSYKGASANEFKAQNPNAKRMVCGMCSGVFYAINPRNTKFCGPKCGRDMSNVYKMRRNHSVGGIHK